MKGEEPLLLGDILETRQRPFQKRRCRKEFTSVPDGIRTRVTGLKGQRPGPLDDGDMSRGGIEPPTLGLKGRCSTD